MSRQFLMRVCIYRVAVIVLSILKLMFGDSFPGRVGTGSWRVRLIVVSKSKYMGSIFLIR